MKEGNLTRLIYKLPSSARARKRHLIKTFSG